MKKFALILGLVFAVSLLAQAPAKAGWWIGFPLPVPVFYGPGPAWYGPGYYGAGYYWGPYGHRWYGHPYWRGRYWARGRWNWR